LEISQYTTALGHMAHNARRLGEVADGVRRSLYYHRGLGEQKASAFHSDRHFAKPLVIRRADVLVCFLFNNDFGQHEV